MIAVVVENARNGRIGVVVFGALVMRREIVRVENIGER